jgi:hypothetical protein
VAFLNIQQPLEVEEIVQNVQYHHQQPLLLRHASVSSLDESSQKYRAAALTNQTLMANIDNRPLYKNASHPQRAFGQLKVSDGFK